MAVRVRALDGPVHELAEQPAWCADRGVLAWVDVTGRSVWTAAPGGAARLLCRTRAAASGVVAVPGHGEDWWVADGLEVTRCDGAGRVLGSLPLPGDDSRLPADGWRLNGIGVDPDGHLWGGLFAVPAGRDRGGLRRFGAPAASPWTTAASNGFAWDATGACWHVDTLDRVVRHAPGFGTAGAAVPAPRPLPVPDDLPGRPDGIAVHDARSVRLAMWDGGCLVDLTLDGRVPGRVDLPVSRPTALCPHPGGGWVVTSARAAGEELSGRLLHLEDDR